MIVIGVLIVAKAAYTMFFEKDYWEKVAEKVKKDNVEIKANRGNILSSDGKLMASSLPEYYLYMDFMTSKKKNETPQEKRARIKLQNKKDSLLYAKLDSISQGLHAIFPDKSAAYFKQHIRNGRRKQSRYYLMYPRRVSYIQYKAAQQLPFFNLGRNASGFYGEEYNQRKHPFGSLASRTLGRVYAAKDSAVNGLELAFDSVLRGRNGLVHRQKVMNTFLDIVDVPPVDGCDIVTTIDVGMQDIAEKSLVDMLMKVDAKVGVAILMEVATGEIKAIVNMTKCNDGQYREIRNNAISDMMEPGSVFKTASLMVALEDGVITTKDGVDTGNGVLQMHGSDMKDHNHKKGGYQYLTVPEILMYSSNIGVSYLIDKYYFNNPNKFVDGIYRIGLNRPLQLQIPGEGIPNIRKKGENGKNWSNTTLAWMSIGYETQIPPMNILTFYNAIANNGVMVKPKFVKEIRHDDEVIKKYHTEVLNPSICSPQTLKSIQDMLRLVVSDGLGKSAGSGQFPVSGKTGTAQISQGADGYKSGTVNYLLSFVGYFPSDTPKYSCMVAIQKSGYPASSGWSAKVFNKIAERVYAKDLTGNLLHAVDTISPHLPKVKNGNIANAEYVLDALGIRNTVSIDGITENVFITGKTYNKGSDLMELIGQEQSEKFVPDVKGMGAKDAVFLLENMGLKVHLSGMGKVYYQSILHGTLIRKGQIIELKLK